MSNMSYCMFENTSRDMQDVIDRICEDDFNPNNLSKRERRAYDEMYDQVVTMKEYFEQIEQQDWNAEIEEE